MVYCGKHDAEWNGSVCYRCAPQLIKKLQPQNLEELFRNGVDQLFLFRHGIYNYYPAAIIPEKEFDLSDLLNDLNQMPKKINNTCIRKIKIRNETSLCGNLCFEEYDYCLLHDQRPQTPAPNLPIISPNPENYWLFQNIYKINIETNMRLYQWLEKTLGLDPHVVRVSKIHITLKMIKQLGFTNGLPEAMLVFPHLNLCQSIVQTSHTIVIDSKPLHIQATFKFKKQAPYGVLTNDKCLIQLSEPIRQLKRHIEFCQNVVEIDTCEPHLKDRLNEAPSIYTIKYSKKMFALVDILICKLEVLQTRSKYNMIDDKRKYREQTSKINEQLQTALQTLSRRMEFLRKTSISLKNNLEYLKLLDKRIGLFSPWTQF